VSGFRAAAVAVFVVAVTASALGIGVRATFGAHVAVDEPQYVLTAISLVEDGDLDISDERAERRWRAFADLEPPVQAQPRAGGSRISPHDPLLPILLAVPIGLGGWVGGKLALALLAGAVAVLTLWVAVRRFDMDVRLAAAGVGLAAASAPLAVYGQQLYPELPAAAVTLVGVAAVTGRARAGSLALLVGAVTALPWLSIKYAPVAAALAVVGAVRVGAGRGGGWEAGRRRELALAAAALAVMGAGYLLVHKHVWGGWTVYASGDHFQGSGELGVVGFAPNYPGRAQRLVSLLVDRRFGIAAWQPAWLLLVPALGGLVARRPRGWPALVLPLVAGWLVATFVAVTMHGYWWPGRQLVVVLPVAVLVVLWWLNRSGRAVRAVAAGLGLAGVVTYGWLLADGWAGRITWVSGFWETGAPLYRLVRPLLPDYTGDSYLPGHAAWAALLLAAAAAGWWWARFTATGIGDPGGAGPAAAPDAGQAPARQR
jgi:hypothetical protein